MTLPDESASEHLSDTLARMGALLFSEQTVDAILELVVELAVEALDGVEAASITLRRTGKEQTSHASSEIALDVDQAQYDSGHGPCLTAARTGTEILLDIAPGDARWPEFADAALARGLLSSASIPLEVGDEPMGALNVYSTGVDSFAAHELRAIRLFAQQASVAISNAVAFTRVELINENLQEALATRETIGQAKGILMARERVSPDEAFDILRRASQRSNRKLRDLAQEIVESAYNDPT